LEGRDILAVQVNWYFGKIGETKNSGKKMVRKPHGRLKIAVW
jgi:hypothetical protein